MNFLVSCNDRYAMPLTVMLTSLLSTNPVSFRDSHTVYMLESELSDDANNRIADTVTHLGAAYIQIRLTPDIFAAAKTRPHITKETYYRLLAAQFLPQSLDRVLWLDADLIVRGGLRAFYDTELGGAWAAACGYGPAMQAMIRSNADSLGMQYPDRYFNAGVMLMDLAACRQEITEDALARFTGPATTDGLLFPGQDVVNLLFDGHVTIEDYRLYNCMTHCITSAEDLAYAKEHAKIVHFPGAAKPWKFNDIHFADEWMDWYRICFCEATTLPRMSYFRLKALYDKQGNTKK